MANRRAFHNPTILPDGNVLITGGRNDAGWLRREQGGVRGGAVVAGDGDLSDRAACLHPAALSLDSTAPSGWARIDGGKW